MSFFTALALLLIGLQLTDHIQWSWWAVTAPLWVPFAVAFVIAFCRAFAVAYKKAKKRDGSSVPKS